ncbi:Gfo/Idh/MocA family protein [Modestobacter marinus]|uniref:Gfo/Idh/MocA family protein n=1 Tax=Modestobacter marinus TaxID=477641 RepID=UPI00201B29DF|nr:Gfo/Idh/MocA family oxidoreductase [Modestobacter marinus]
MTTPLRTALIGVGTAGRVFHGPLLATDPDYAVTVVSTADPDRAGQATAAHPDAVVVPTPDDALARAVDLDLVIIGTPPHTHADLAHRAIDAGLAVVVDKPFTVTSVEGREVIEHARAAGVPLTVHQNRRWDADFLTLRELLAHGRLGTVHRFESRFEWWKPVPPDTWKGRLGPEQGGGILFDLGTHLIDQAVQLFGPVEGLSAETDVRRAGGGADDDTFVVLEHTSGVRSHLWMSSVAAQPGPRFRVLGSRAGYVSWELDGQEAALKEGLVPTDPDWGLTPPDRWGTLGVPGALEPVPAARGDYGAFYRLLSAALRSGGPLPVDPADSLHVIELIERLRRSAAAA